KPHLNTATPSQPRFVLARPIPAVVPRHIPTEPIEAKPEAGIFDPHHFPSHLPEEIEAEDDLLAEIVELVPDVPARGTSPLLIKFALLHKFLMIIVQ
ncbi:hypothetical protein FRC11_011574, partial [Ceratobasidium sp. 423]